MTHNKKGKNMKKLLKLLPVMLLAFTLAACDSGAKQGDTVVINFAGYMDGVQFPGGTADGFPLTLGSGTFVPGFEDQLVGIKRGETRDVTITFPENYVPGLSGQSVIFKVTAVEIKR
jgi:trigger factor